MTIAGDLDQILIRYGVLKEDAQKCISDIMAFLFCGDVVSYLLNDEQDTTAFYAALSSIEKKIII